MTVFQWVVAPLLFTMAAQQIARLVFRRGSRSRGLLWACVWGGGGLLVVRPDISQRVAEFVGVGRGSDLVLYSALVAGLFVSFALYRRSRRLEIMVTDLARHLAIERAENGRG